MAKLRVARRSSYGSKKTVAQGIPDIGAYIGFLFGPTVALIIVLKLLITPRDPRPTPEKKKPVESGQIAVGPGRTRFIIQYYPSLLMFVVYDVIHVPFRLGTESKGSW